MLNATQLITYVKFYQGSSKSLSQVLELMNLILYKIKTNSRAFDRRHPHVHVYTVN